MGGGHHSTKYTLKHMTSFVISFFYLMVIIYNKISTIGYKINKLHVYTLQLTLTPYRWKGGGGIIQQTTHLKMV